MLCIQSLKLFKINTIILMMQMEKLKHRDTVTCPTSHNSLSRDLVFDTGLSDAGAYVFHYTTDFEKQKDT